MTLTCCWKRMVGQVLWVSLTRQNHRSACGEQAVSWSRCRILRTILFRIGWTHKIAKIITRGRIEEIINRLSVSKRPDLPVNRRKRKEIRGWKPIWLTTTTWGVQISLTLKRSRICSISVQTMPTCSKSQIIANNSIKNDTYRKNFSPKEYPKNRSTHHCPTDPL